MTEIKDGPHLGVIRRWIKNNARNGCDVRWGSGEFLGLRSVTVHEMECLAQDIADAVEKDVRKSIKREEKIAQALEDHRTQAKTRS